MGDSVLDFSLAALVPFQLLPSSLAGVTGAARERRFLTTTTVGCAAGGSGVPTATGGPAGGAGVPTGAGGAPAGGRGLLPQTAVAQEVLSRHSHTRVALRAAPACTSIARIARSTDSSARKICTTHAEISE